MPDVFKSSTVPLEPGKTLIQVPVGAGTMFEETKGRSLSQCTDGTVNTILFVQVSPEKAVYWTQPEDYQFDAGKPSDGLGIEPGSFTAGFADGTVKQIKRSADADLIKALFTRNGGEAVSSDVFASRAGPGGFGPPGMGPRRIRIWEDSAWERPAQQST